MPTYMHPTQEHLADLRGRDQDQPIVMLNLLAFRPHTNHDGIAAGMTAEQAYAEYVRRIGDLDCFQGDTLLEATGGRMVIGPDGKKWDKVILVRYDTIRSFIEMIEDPDYQAVVGWRTAALADSRLVAFDG